MSFTQDLLAWGRLHGRRDLPWQQKTKGRLNVYWVWVSEVMLQQTQVQTVRDYFFNFVRRFPSRASLAAAPVDDVLSAWSGLGYYRRARNLHAAARLLELHYPEGHWPQTREAWQSLPGLGRSTAAAIVSCCFQAREPILDGNVKRVLARQICAEQPWGSTGLERLLWEEAQQRLPDQAGDMPLYTQSVMDLGATVCLPRRPDCGRCPVRQHCRAHLKGESLAFPRPKPLKARPVRSARWLVCLRPERLQRSEGVDQPKGAGVRLQIGLQQQPEQGIWAGLWSFPTLDDQLVLPPHWEQYLTFQHDFSHYRLAVSLWLPRWLLEHLSRQSQSSSTTPFLWVAQDWSESPLPWPESQLVYRSFSEWLGQGIPSPVRRVLTKLAESFEA